MTMKRFIFISVCAFISGVQLFAQDAYDAEQIASSDLNGTARYVAMGGALGALGGDISVLSDNPAGLGIFKKHDISFTTGVVIGENAGVLDHSKARMSLDQIGFVYAMESEGDILANIGFNYHKKSNYLYNLNTVVGGLNGGSQTFDAARLVNGHGTQSIFEDLMSNSYIQGGKDVLSYDNSSKWYAGSSATYADYRRSSRGSNSQFDVDLSLNVGDQVFFGFGIGCYSINSKWESIYYEQNRTPGSVKSNENRGYDIYSWNETKGDGFDLKFGTIIRPIESSPFRFGVAIHTPTWYNIQKTNGADLNLYDVNDNVLDYFSAEGGDFYDSKYRFRTPWKFDFSLGTTVGSWLALGAEYTVQDLSTCKYYYGDDSFFSGTFSDINHQIKSSLKTQHTLKLGVECKPTDQISVRLGYNYVSSPFTDGAYKDLNYNAEDTETVFINWKDQNRYTAGLGYRFKGGYLDFTYQYVAQDGDFYAFSNKIKEVGENGNYTPTLISNNRHQLMATLGFRF